jgi:hypothetical protein
MRAAAALTVAAVLSLPVLLAGCGGGGGKSSGEFTTVAESACTGASKQIAALGAPQASGLVKYLEATDSIVAKVKAKVEGVKGQGEGEKVYVEGLQVATKALGEMVLAAQARNSRSVGEVSERLTELHLGKLAEEAGLESCAKVLVVKS